MSTEMCTVITTLFKWAIFYNNLGDLLKENGLILWFICVMSYYCQPVVRNYEVADYLLTKENVPGRC